MSFFTASRRATSIPTSVDLLVEFDATDAVADLAVQVSNLIPGLATIDAGFGEIVAAAETEGRAK